MFTLKKKEAPFIKQRTNCMAIFGSCMKKVVRHNEDYLSKTLPLSFLDVKLVGVVCMGSITITL
jgi:hypothetical protein